MRKIISNGPNTVMEGIFTGPVVETRFREGKRLEREKRKQRAIRRLVLKTKRSES